ncbi:hypothetical protein [Ensifer soli]|uniref:hypothetical protein n=1 Tax=Ciceribacter sp. sgz301302 TaxID=3342379 RepID=UPI0035BA2337
MAFSGLHVTAGYSGPSERRDKTIANIFGRIISSETLASAGSTTIVAPPVHEGQGMPIFRIQAAADSWVAIGAAPNASTGPRTLARAGVDYDVYVQPGDKVAWTAA